LDGSRTFRNLPEKMSMIHPKVMFEITDYLKREDPFRYEEWIVANSDSQWKHKTFIVDKIFEIQDSFDCVWIFAPWFGHITIPRLLEKAEKIVVFDYDIFPVSSMLKKYGKENVFVCERDVNFDLMLGKCNIFCFDHPPDLILNTACEHMYYMKALGIEAFPLYALQGNNKIKSIGSEINRIDSTETLIEQAGITEVLHASSDEDHHTVIGYA